MWAKQRVSAPCAANYRFDRLLRIRWSRLSWLRRAKARSWPHNPAESGECRLKARLGVNETDRCRFSQATFAGAHGNGRDAPTAAVPITPIERSSSTHLGPYGSLTANR